MKDGMGIEYFDLKVKVRIRYVGMMGGRFCQIRNVTLVSDDYENFIYLIFVCVPTSVSQSVN